MASANPKPGISPTMTYPKAAPTHPEALPSSRRVRRRREYVRAYENGRKFHSRFTAVFVVRNEQVASRLGITATRKLGKANVRNRLKRRVREIFRREKMNLGLDSLPVDLVVNVKRAAVECSFSAFRDDFIQVLAKIARSVDPTTAESEI